MNGNKLIVDSRISHQVLFERYSDLIKKLIQERQNLLEKAFVKNMTNEISISYSDKDKLFELFDDIAQREEFFDVEWRFEFFSIKAKDWKFQIRPKYSYEDFKKRYRNYINQLNSTDIRVLKNLFTSNLKSGFLARLNKDEFKKLELFFNKIAKIDNESILDILLKQENFKFVKENVKIYKNLKKKQQFILKNYYLWAGYFIKLFKNINPWDAPDKVAEIILTYDSGLKEKKDMNNELTTVFENITEVQRDFFAELKIDILDAQDISGYIHCCKECYNTYKKNEQRYEKCIEFCKKKYLGAAEEE